ncbi:unnamed protein product [Cylindrotheca closterium]|uniref:Pseudouridine synthase RsuA/RluA-like domain-containing protein n=1 Tax=Cylindrotheca closterium TaxID=2856 RepID=A0AAD2G7T6_9STRA|nr:unnamed protein product [Cylindrotheca closterium]
MLFLLPFTLLLFLRLPANSKKKQQQTNVRNALSALHSTPLTTGDLSDALQLAYNDEGIAGVLSHCHEYKITETYEPKELVRAALQVPSKGAASGILNALIGSCCCHDGDGDGDGRDWKFAPSPISDGDAVKEEHMRNARTALRILQEYDDASFEDLTTTATTAKSSTITLALKPNVVTLALTYTASFQSYPRIANKLLSRAIIRQNLKTLDRPTELSGHGQTPASTLEILLESEHFMIVNKLSGMVLTTAETSANSKSRSSKQMIKDAPNLEQILLAHQAAHHHKPIRLSSINPDGSRGFVHRLDRGTSGCLIAAKTNQWHARLLTQFFLRRVEKSYIALVYTNSISLPEEGTVTVPIDGRPAISSFQVLERYPDDLITKIRVTTKQGRKHQVRIHCSKGLGAPILLDPLYGGESIMYRLPNDSCAKKYRAQQRICLHADSLAISDLNIPKVEAAIPEWWDNLTKDIHHYSLVN